MARRRRSIKTRGLVLRWVPYSNTSQVVTLFTRDEGVVSVLAKGSLRGPRRSASFPQPLDLSGWYDVVFSERAGELELLTEARLVEGFDHLRGSLEAYVEACFALDLLARTSPPRDPNPELLRGALSHLKLLGVGTGRLALRVHLAHRVLASLGVCPTWGPTAQVLRPSAGVLTAVEAREAPSPADVPLDPETVAFLAWEFGQPWGAIPTSGAPRPTVRSAWSILEILLVHLLDRPPRTLRYLRGGFGGDDAEPRLTVESGSATMPPNAAGIGSRGESETGGRQ